MICPAKSELEASVLLDYALNRLPVPELAMVERHVQDCPDCFAVVEAQRNVFSALETWEAMPVSVNFNRGLYARIEQEESRSWRRFLPQNALPRWRHAFLPAAALCAAMFAAVLLQTPNVVPTKITDDAALHLESIEVEQVETTLDDLEMLRQLTVSPGGKSL